MGLTKVKILRFTQEVVLESNSANDITSRQ